MSTASQQIAELDAEIERLKAERRRLLGAKWIALIPADAPERLYDMAVEAAINCGGPHHQGEACWDIAPGVTIIVTIIVTYDTDIQDDEDGEDGQ